MRAPTNFDADLARSQTPAIHAAIWRAVSKRFPEADAITPADICDDKKGTDFWIDFANGKRESLDYKVRYVDWHDKDPLHRTAFIELVANETTGKVGWSIDPMKQTDWIVFYYADSDRFIFYNARELRAAVIAYLPYLKRSGRPETTTTDAYGGSFQSSGIIVSHEELEKCIYANKRSKPKAA